MNDNLDKEILSPELALDDEQRIKTLSPMMLVVQRFVRNKLAMVGLVIIVVMFLFAFVGGAFSPYTQKEVFNTIEPLETLYASATVNEDFRFYPLPGQTFSAMGGAQFIKAVNNGETEFSDMSGGYTLTQVGESLYSINAISKMADVLTVKIINEATPVEGSGYTEEIFALAIEAHKQALSSFDYNGETYYIADTSDNGREWMFGPMRPVAVASKMLFDMYDASATVDAAFVLAAQSAFDAGESQFDYDGLTYTFSNGTEQSVTINDASGKPYTDMTTVLVVPAAPDNMLSVDYKTAARLAVLSMGPGVTRANFTVTGDEADYSIRRADVQYDIYALTDRVLIDIHQTANDAHMLGTDSNGMDVLTRLMYGGRISLMIGFIVVFIEIFIAIIIGGLAGYFGKWVDTLLMRVVDIFLCIPSLPILIILGAVMDSMRVDPMLRMVYMMAIMGFLGWPTISRIIRGQILSLREQEFMVATEATGLSIYRRIFKHLIPNVIPQLIVFATLDLGSVIILESTLSFLGLGVKFPFATWGNIINGVGTAFNMVTYPNEWLPAALCMLITVLGFNFIGDGLRDAFDPKMKR